MKARKLQTKGKAMVRRMKCILGHFLPIAASMIFMGSHVQPGSQALANETDASLRFGAFTDNVRLYVSEDGLESWMVGSARKGPLPPESKSEILVVARMGTFSSEIEVYHFEQKMDDPAGQLTGYIYTGEDRRTKAPRYSPAPPPTFDGDGGLTLTLPSKALNFHLSADKRELLVLETGKTKSRTIVARVREPDGAARKKWGVLSNLAGNTYQVGESFHFYDWSSRETLVRRIYSAKLYNDPELISICEFSYDSNLDDFSCPVGSAPGQSRSSFRIISHDAFLINNEVKPLRLLEVPGSASRSFLQDQATNYEASFFNINRLQVLVDFQGKRDLFLAERAGDERVRRRQEERQSETIWANAFRAMPNAQPISAGVDLLRPTPLPSAPTSRGGMGDMGGISRTEAPRMTPQQQAQFEELERIKMREQIARGERPTTIAEDAKARMAGATSTAGQRRDQSGSGSSTSASSTRAQPAATQQKSYVDIRYYLWITMPSKPSDTSAHACFTSTARSLAVPADLPNLGTPGDINSLIAADIDSFLSRCALARRETTPLRKNSVQVITVYRESDFAMLDQDIAEWSRDSRRATSVQ